MTKKQRDFCLKVKRAVLDEPRHLLMDQFVRGFKAGEKTQFKNEYEASPKLECGTVGCIAGYACSIGTGKSLKQLLSARNSYTIDIPDKASGFMGLSVVEADLLFFFPFLNLGPDSTIYEDERNLLRGTKPGSRAYARVVAKAIDKAIERNYTGANE